MLFKRISAFILLTLVMSGTAPTFAYEAGSAGPLLPQTGDPLQWQCRTTNVEILPLVCKLPPLLETASNKEQAAAHIKRGLHLFQRMKFEEAGKEFASAVRVEPAAFETHLLAARYELGMFAMFLVPQHLEKAESYLREAEKLAPTNIDIISTRAYALWNRLRRSDALDLYSSVISSDPRHVFSRKQRAQIYLQAGNLQLALADYDILLLLAPDNIAWRRPRAFILMQLARYEDAVTDLSVFIEDNPHFQDVFVLRATAHALSGNTKEALTDLNVALDSTRFVLGDDKRAELLMKRSFLLMKLKQHSRAVADALEAVSIDGIHRILRLQLFLKKKGLKVEIDGKVSDAMRRAISDCFGIDDCAVWLFEKT